MIVVDTNIVAYFWLPGDHTEKAKRLFQKDPKWISSLLWRSEFRNILLLYIRKKVLDGSTAFEIMNEAEKMMKGNEYSIRSSDILEKSLVSKLSAYDLEFVVLAESLKLNLVTLDKDILKEFPAIAISL